ncbi:uncharacterized protein DS421_8g246430 [Arachis hypogaea]|nr:uncharacterized protein DS421_8g246430 [Arachis hypogaea]
MAVVVVWCCCYCLMFLVLVLVLVGVGSGGSGGSGVDGGCGGNVGGSRGGGVRKVKRRMMMMRVFWSKNAGNDDFKAFLNVEDDFNNEKRSGTILILTQDVREENNT